VRTATVCYLTDRSCELSTPYVAEFVTELKYTIPNFARSWIAERKIWIVSAQYADVAVQLAERYFTVIELNKEQKRSYSSAHCARAHYDPDSDHSKLHLLPTAPAELVKVAYRCLVILYHPDHGGDITKMQTINAAYERLAK